MKPHKLRRPLPGTLMAINLWHLEKHFEAKVADHLRREIYWRVKGRKWVFESADDRDIHICFKSRYSIGGMFCVTSIDNAMYQLALNPLTESQWRARII